MSKTKCEHGFWVEGGVETCPTGCPQSSTVGAAAVTVPCRTHGSHQLSSAQAERVIVTLFGVVEDHASGPQDFYLDEQCAKHLLATSFHGEGYAEHCESWLGNDHAETTEPKVA